MNILLTVSSLIAAFACGLACLVVNHNARASAEWARVCAQHAQKLAGERARVTTLERETDALRKWIQRVDGKLSQVAREMPPYEPAEAVLNRDTATIPMPLSSAFTVCENFAQAQREGPLSAAAQCACPYCTAKRVERDQLRERARALPTHAATVRAVKDKS